MLEINSRQNGYLLGTRDCWVPFRVVDLVVNFSPQLFSKRSNLNLKCLFQIVFSTKDVVDACVLPRAFLGVKADRRKVTFVVHIPSLGSRAANLLLFLGT